MFLAQNAGGNISLSCSACLALYGAKNLGIGVQGLVKIFIKYLMAGAKNEIEVGCFFVDDVDTKRLGPFLKIPFFAGTNFLRLTVSLSSCLLLCFFFPIPALSEW